MDSIFDFSFFFLNTQFFFGKRAKNIICGNAMLFFDCFDLLFFFEYNSYGNIAIKHTKTKKQNKTKQKHKQTKIKTQNNTQISHTYICTYITNNIILK